MRKTLILCAAFAAALHSSAGAMDVATYLAKGQALRAKGPFAVLSSDYKELQAEVITSAASLKTERLTAVRQGRRPSYCPPAKVSLAPEEIFAAMEAVPVAQRARTSVKEALRAAFARKYPCSG